jgi:hypothetical protein
VSSVSGHIPDLLATQALPCPGRQSGAPEALPPERLFVHNADVAESTVVLVPADRIGAFQAAVSTFVGTGKLTKAKGGSDGKSWTEVPLPPLPAANVAEFYRQFADWLEDATKAAPEREPKHPSPEALVEAMASLPKLERELLFLLSDDGGRTVAWAEVKKKFSVAGPAELASVLPKLGLLAKAGGWEVPIESVGEKDDAAFRLLPEFIGPVSRFRPPQGP